MFVYCVDVLHFSEASAYKRIRAARIGREHPELIASIRAGELHVTALGLIAPHVTLENVGEMIAMARHQTRAEIEKRLADRRPKGAVVTSVRRQCVAAIDNPTAIPHQNPAELRLHPEPASPAPPKPMPPRAARPGPLVRSDAALCEPETDQSLRASR